MEKDSVNILCLDGGGIRGLMTADILIHVEKRLNELTNNNKKIGEYFDLIVGTSTGGILTAIYSIPDSFDNFKYSATDAKDLYLNNGSKIFKRNIFRKIGTMLGFIKPRYGNKNLKSIIDKYISPNLKISEAKTNIMITSVSLKNSALYLFKSYNKTYYNNTFKDACVATSAAPTYFPPHKVGNKYLIDGGMALNNPTLSAYVEAKKLFPNKKLNILSVGTGSKIDDYNDSSVLRRGIIWWVRKIMDITLVSSSKAVEYQSDVLFRDANIGNYLRIDPIIEKSSEKMDNISSENVINLIKDSNNTIKRYKKSIDEFLNKIIKEG